MRFQFQENVMFESLKQIENFELSSCVDKERELFLSHFLQAIWTEGEKVFYFYILSFPSWLFRKCGGGFWEKCPFRLLILQFSWRKS